MDIKEEYSNLFQIRLKSDNYQCPSCDATLKPNEIQKHCDLETEQLSNMHPLSDENLLETNCEERNTKTRSWSVFQKVQKNRESRLKLRNRKRLPQDHVCPICNINMTHNEIHSHIEHCLNHDENGCSGLREEDDGDYSFEEYEWAGQKRIRVSSLLQGGYASIGVGTSLTNHNDDDDDEDLNVDEDDTQLYGPAQYTESDVITPLTQNNTQNDNDVTSYMRSLITGRTVEAFVSKVNKGTEQESDKSSSTQKTNSIGAETCLGAEQEAQNSLQIMESLKAKLRLLENQVQNKFKCLICLDDYKNPAISVSCWHVHCEECWLRSLGARKLCPQCNLITSPSDLRRIFM